MKIFPNSLSFRLLAITAMWTVLALLLTGIILSTLFRQNAERNFDGLLLAHTFNLMGAVDANEKGVLEGSPNLGDPRFLTPLSGWYWSVSKASDPGKSLLHSMSITGDLLDVPPTSKIPFTDVFRRTYTVTSPQDQVSQRLEAQLFVGESDVLYQVMVAANRSDLEETIAEFNQSLIMFFSVFGLGTIIATFFVIRYGLKPLDKAAQSLGEVRDGRSDRIEGEFPTEVAPLVGEINALIDANRAVVDRARTQVGNLAHALKTPLAVISNEVNSEDSNKSSTIADQTNLMRGQIQTYLNRARIAAQVGVITARTPVDPVVERIIRVMSKLYPNIDFGIKTSDQTVFAGEEQDLEEILGNLFENAGLHAKSTVQISVLSLPRSDKRRAQLELRIEDDGKGVDANQRVEILKRGNRLDESIPGSGLGLSIVKDISDEYEGDLRLEDSALGGLCVAVLLPRIVAKNAG